MKYGILIMFLVIVGLFIMADKIYADEKESGIFENQGLQCLDFVKNIDKEYTCCRDCGELNQDYAGYDYRYVFIGGDEEDCFCDNKGEVQQIW